ALYRTPRHYAALAPGGHPRGDPSRDPSRRAPARRGVARRADGARRARGRRAAGADEPRRARDPRPARLACGRPAGRRGADRRSGPSRLVPRGAEARAGLRQGDGRARVGPGRKDRLQVRRPAAAAQLRGPGGALMGLFTGLLTLPLAPVRGTVWIAEQLAAEAERELREAQSPRRRLLV